MIRCQFAFVLACMCGCFHMPVAVSENSPDHKAMAAAAIAVWEAEKGSTPKPAPKPTPAPGLCENCGGRGRLGDGTISVPCPVCGGDGRTDNSKPSLVQINPEAFADIQPARRWQAVVLGGTGCKACMRMKEDVARELGRGWLIEEVEHNELGFVSFVPASEADILFDDNWESYREYGMKEGDLLPCTLIFADGEVADRINGRVPAGVLASRIIAVASKLKPRSNDFQAIRGGTLEAKEAIGQILDQAKVVLGEGGSVTLQRPAGEIDAGQVVISLKETTSAVVRMQGETLVLTFTPAPRIKIEGVPLLHPAVAGATISKDQVRVDLLRWPDVTLGLK